MRATILICLFIVSLSTHAQTGDTSFRADWLQIDTMIVKNDLTVTALNRIEKLYEKAKQQKKPVQLVKALLYQNALQDRINTQDPAHAIKRIQAEIKKAIDPVQKALLHSLLAHSYFTYYRPRIYQLYGRANTTSRTEKDDIGSWSNSDFMNAIGHHFSISLENKELLQHQKLEMYDAVIIGGANDQQQTLFDILAHEALDYFKSGYLFDTKPVNLFTMSDERLLGSADDFIHAKFKTTDSSSLLWQGLQLFQRLLSFHRADADKEAFVSLDIERIEWVYQNAVFTDKDKKYIQALRNITASNTQSPAPSVAQAWYLIAKQEVNKAGAYNAWGDTTGRYGYVRAKDIIGKAMGLFPAGNNGCINMQNLLLQINRKELATETEVVNVPAKDFRAYVKYRNTDTLFARIIRMDDATDYIRKFVYTDAYWANVTSISSYKTFVQALPKTNDFQMHSVEIKIDALPVGAYALLCSSNASFSGKPEKLHIQFFYVSNISYVKNKNDFFVLDRETGKPLADVKAMINRRVNWSGYNYEHEATKTTDQNGHFTFVSNNVGMYQYSFTKGDDRLNIYEGEYTSFNNFDQPATTAERYESDNTKVFYFTDRSIYRPGQSVFFKGIVVTRDYLTRLNKPVLTKETVKLYLRDVNYKVVDTLTASVNDYGSFTGKFQIPQNVLTGRFTIQATTLRNGQAFFSVEEYKRPNFNVDFETLKGSYRLGDSITLKGTARADAGNLVNGSKVKYKVTRSLQYQNLPYWKINYRINNREIAYGEVETDAQGMFTISFKAEGDDITERSGNPSINFSISADVTDISGETRSANTTLNIGFSALKLQVSVPELAEKDSLKKIGVLTTNFSNEKQAADVQLRISPLQSPGRLIRNRYWQRPDQYLYTKEEFLRYFPTDEYADEASYLNWPVGDPVLQTNFNTGDGNKYVVPAGILSAGFYKLEAITHDAYGQEEKQVRYFQLYDRKEEKFALSYFINYTQQNNVEPGQTASFITASSVSSAFVISKTEKKRLQKTSWQFSTRKAGFTELKYTPQEEDRGGVVISEVFIFNNRVYTNQDLIDVPWSNKKLKITYSSYRNKTEPGAPEKWTVQVTGNEGEKVAAELLTGMYDASLDQFTAPFTWQSPNIWEYDFYSRVFEAQTNFRMQDGISNNTAENYLPVSPAPRAHLAAHAAELWNRDLVRWINDASLHLSSLKPLLSRLNDIVWNYDGENRIAGMGNLRMRSSMTAGAVKADTMEFRATEFSKDEVLVDGKRFFGDDAKATDLINKLPPMTVNIDGTIVGGTFSGTLGSGLPFPAIPAPIPVQVRKNFNETAFFFPQLHADESGNFSFTFTMPEALTQWKWMSIAHTKDLAFGAAEATILTQKKLMVQTNAPRFLREGDNIEFSSRIVNMSDKEITGQVALELIDPSTNTSIDGWFQNVFPSQYITVEAGQSFAVKFPIQIPFGYNRPLIWRIKAVSGDVSDGEENILPILTNRTLVTETLPIFLQNDSTQRFTFDKLLNSKSETLTQHALTVEYTSNPVWYAVQALPYLMEYPYECAEQTFNRFYANTLAAFIVNKNPRIRQVFEKWKKDSSSLKSNLQKNEELKQVLLQETPWVIQAENEEQQKKNIALLFDLVKISDQSASALNKLLQMQLSNGSFPWFKGGNGDVYITNYIVTGIGKLRQLGALSDATMTQLRQLLSKSIQYLDTKMSEQYRSIEQSKTDMKEYVPYSAQISYLYMRSFFREIKQDWQKEYNYFYAQGKKTWVKQNSYYRAELGLISYRNGEKDFATKTILPAILENASSDTKQGMYWASAYAGSWYQSPIEHQSMMITFMSEISGQELLHNINLMKTWLLLNKQTNNWKTTIATADACYALLLKGSDWLNAEKNVTIQLGRTVISSTTEKQEAGTGYFKKTIEGEKVGNDMGKITVTVSTASSTKTAAQNTSPSWGSVYWQYFEDLDQITPAASPLSITKKLFIERNTNKGKVLDPVSENQELATGDKIVVRLELRSNRDMDYLHLKDMRASAMEPVNVLSGYKWQDGLGYYESTKDASTNFFIDHLRKGTYVFDYPLFVTHTGIFSVGIASIQCMYAPEFTSHSGGIKIRVK